MWKKSNRASNGALYRDQFIQLWNSELSRQTSKRGEAGNKLQTSSPDSNWRVTSQVKVAKYRTALTKLRVSCHRLQIELGRYHKPRSIPPEQRLCKLCNCIEDEVHFVCVRPVFIIIIIRLLPGKSVWYEVLPFVMHSVQFSREFLASHAGRCSASYSVVVSLFAARYCILVYLLNSTSDYKSRGYVLRILLPLLPEHVLSRE